MKFFKRRNDKVGGKKSVPPPTTAAAAARAVCSVGGTTAAPKVYLSKSTDSNSPTGSSSLGTAATTGSGSLHQPNRTSIINNSNNNNNRANNPFASKSVTKALAHGPFASTNKGNKGKPIHSHSHGHNGHNSDYKQRKTIKQILIQLDDDDFLEEELDVEDTCRQIVYCLHDVDAKVEDVISACKALQLLAMADESDLDTHRCVTMPGVESLLELMEAYGEEPNLQQQACMALEALVAWEGNQKTIVASQEGVGTIISAMDRHGLGRGDRQKGDVRDPKIVASCLSILCHLSKNHGEELTDAVPIILHLLRHDKDNAPLYRRGCLTLANITKGSSDKSRSSQLILSRQQGVPVVLKALTNPPFVTDIEIQASSMRILEYVASHPSVEVKGKIVLQGGIDRIMECLQRHTVADTTTPAVETPTKARSIHVKRPSPTSNPFDDDDDDDDEDDDVEIDNHPPPVNAAETEALTKREITASALQTMANLSRDGSADETKRQLGKAVPVILKIIRQHPNNVTIQVSGFEALRNLATLNGESILALGGVATVLMTMLQLPEVTALQDHACATLTNLFVGSRMATSSSNGNGNGTSTGTTPVNLNYDLVHSMATEDGLSIIFQTIRLHQANLQVQEQAFGTLFFLSCSQDYLTARQREQLCLEENIFVLLGTMNQYIHQSELLCQRACGLILNLSFVSPPSQDVVVSVGGIKIILAAMRRHGLNLDIQTFGAGCLAGLCLEPSHHEEFVNEEGISTMLAAMMIHPGHPTIQAYGCEVLSNVATSSRDYKQTIVNGNAKAVAADALSKHKMHRGVQNRGALLLQALS